MRQESLTWIISGILVLFIVGLCILRPQPSTDSSRTYKPHASRPPENVMLTSIQDGAKAYTFSSDGQRVYYTVLNSQAVQIREYAIATRTERLRALSRLPQDRNVCEVAVNDSGQGVVLLTDDSASPSRCVILVSSVSGGTKLVTRRIPEGSTVQTVSENGMAVAGTGTRTHTIRQRAIYERVPTNPSFLYDGTNVNTLAIPKPYTENRTRVKDETSGEPDFPLSSKYELYQERENFSFESEHTIKRADKSGYEKDYEPRKRAYYQIRFTPPYSPQRDDALYRAPSYSPRIYTKPNVYHYEPDTITITVKYIFISTRRKVHTVAMRWDEILNLVGVSLSGNTTAGNYINKQRQQGFIWRVGRGLRSISYPSSRQTEIFWLSPKGDMVLGLAGISKTKTVLFHWTWKGGFKRLAEIPASIEDISVRCVAPNGRAVLLEKSAYSDERTFFIWSASGGFRKSERLREILIEPLCISSDGRKVLSKTKWGIAIVKLD